MAGECFVCVGPASEQYSLVVEGGRVLEDKWMCEQCVSDFRGKEWIEVHEESVLMRGGDDDRGEEDGSE